MTRRRQFSAVLVALALWCFACDQSSPTAPQSVQAASSTSGAAVQICGAGASTNNCPTLAASLELGEQMKVDVLVTLTATEAGISTSLGNFGTNNAGTAITRTTLTLTGGVGSVTFRAGTGAGTANLAANVGTETASKRVVLTEPDALFLQKVDPISGQAKGGTKVTISGQGFATGARVAFGGVQAQPPTMSNATTLQVEVPPPESELAAGESLVVDVTVTNPPASSSSSKVSDTLPNAYTYKSGTLAENVLDIQPRRLTYMGSKKCDLTEREDDCVKITSQGLPSGMPMVAVEFGGIFQTTCSSVDSDACEVSFSGSTTTIEVAAVAVSVQSCAPPSGTVVITNQETGDTFTGPTFTYTAERPVITVVSGSGTTTSDPSAGDQDGGESVTLTGTFSTVEPTTVLFGSVAGTGVMTPTTPDDALTVTAPAFTSTFNTVACGTSGTQQVPTAVDVEVLYPNSGCSFVATGAYTYIPESPMCMEGASPVAAFSFVVTDATLTVVFKDLSSNDPTAWLWTFGDGSSGSIEQNPSHTYAAPGTYQVTLQATNGAGTGSLTQSITLGTAPTADFTFANAPTVSPPDCTLTKIRFTDTSTGTPTSWLWNFGDSTTSTAQNPDHCYLAAGMFTVRLTATNALGSDSTFMVVTVSP